MRSTIPVAALLTLAACAGSETERQQEPDEIATPDTVEPATTDSGETPALRTDYPQMVAATMWSGTVQVVGNDPFPQVVLATQEGAGAGEQFALTGDLRDELGRLHGVTVTVSGRRVPNPRGAPPNAIEVDAYDVTAVNRQPAYLGELTTRNGELWLDGTRRFLLAAVPDELRSREGAKVWVAGVVQGDTLRVQSFGVVREP